MPKGGARSRSGPAPDPNALRRGRADDAEWVTLPAVPDVEVPAWPLRDEAEREGELWERLWGMPQATMWARHHQELEVAQYVRAFVVAEGVDAKAADRTVVRQLATELGLNESGRRTNRWKFAVEAPASGEPAGSPDRSSVKDRLRMVPGGAA